MIEKLKCIMLIDDNPDDNFYHERVIKKNNAAEIVISKDSAAAALEYLRSTQTNNQIRPDLIFLDINMPGMNGWEFLQEYQKLDENSRSQMIVVMLTTSENPDDQLKAANSAAHFTTKPLTLATIEEIMTNHF